MESKEIWTMEDELKKFKDNYNILRKKYSLPEFNELAENFDIEHAIEKETSFVLRDVRKTMAEKITSYMGLFETFKNPAHAPLFIMGILKNAESKDETLMGEIYEKLAKLQLEIIKLDINYSEEKEAEFIKKTSKTWTELKSQIYNLIEKLDKKFLEEKTSTKRGYFG